MSTFSFTDPFTFSEVHAAHHAGRITTDLRHCLHEYKRPAEEMLEKYLEELKILVSRHLVSYYHFGFERGNVPIWGMQYEISHHGDINAESDLAGGIPLGHDVSGANFFNFLTYSSVWSGLTEQQRNEVKSLLPFPRTDGILPGSGIISYAPDRKFNAGGVGTQRSVYGGLV